jgi:hypothetical protein
MKRIIDWLRGKPTKPAAASRRNRPGGMAWIQGLRDVTGENALNGRAVKTLAVNQYGLWTIDPPQDYTATGTAFYEINNTLIRAGRGVSVLSIADTHLEPWKEDGITDGEVRDLYEPSPTKTTEPA